MAILCLGTNKDGSTCSRSAKKATGFCAHHTLIRGEVVAMGTVAAPAKDQWQQDRDSLNDICDQVRAINDLPGLRAAEQEIICAVIDGRIDSKAAPAISQLLKHQQELLQKTTPDGQLLTGEEKQTTIELSLKMTAGEAWALMQDFTGGLARLTKKAKTQIIEVGNGPEQSEDIHDQCAEGVSTAAADEGEILSGTVRSAGAIQVVIPGDDGRAVPDR